jgi:signal transduction histidine kinase
VLLSSAVRQGSGPVDAGLVARASEQVAEEIACLQQIITDLRPAALDDIGLAVALSGLAEREAAVNGLELDCHIDLAWEGGRLSDRLVPPIEDAAYRLVQEAFNNVTKHAGASRARLSVSEDADGLRLEVEDDGQGFDPTAGSDGFGLVGMRERAELAGGTLEIDSAPGRGTRIRAVLPALHASVEGPPGAVAASGA